MRPLDVYSTDAETHLVDTLRDAGRPVDEWINQLSRVSTAPVDLFVNIPESRIVWTFKAKEGTARKGNRYLADYRHDPEGDEDIFSGLYTALTDLSTTENWVFPDDQDERWTAGFDLVRMTGTCPGLNPKETDALATLISSDTEQLVVGMSSYSAALKAIKDLATRDVDGTIAVNSEGATAETEGIDLVLWPGGDRDFQPINDTTAELLSRTGVRRSENMTVAEETPSESVTTVQNRYDDESPVETLIGDTSGRIGALVTFVVGITSVGALGNIGPVHPLSGIATLGGLAGALAGLLLVQPLLKSTMGGKRSAARAKEGQRTRAAKSILSMADWRWQQYAAFAGYWLVLAYAFPTIFRMSEWPYGETIALAGTLPSAGRYVGGLFAASLAVYLVWAVVADRDTDHLTNLGSLGLVHALFAAGLIATTGYACAFWYDLIGFATPAC
jgi:hypothetical protein